MASSVTPSQPRAATTEGAPRPRGPVVASLVSAALAVLAALALPFAPVSANDPVVQWPADPAAPQSSSLLLNAYQPRGLDVTVSCAALEAAAGTPDGVAFATVQPADPSASGYGLVVTADDGRLRVASAGQDLVDQPLPAGGCVLRVTGDADGVVAEVDGEEVGRAGTLPDVDALVTSIGPGQLGPDDLSVQVRVDDQFSSRPAAAKIALILVVLVAGAVSLWSLTRWRSLDGRSGLRRGPDARTAVRGLRPVDLAVALVLLAWLFLAPTTDDDGYYSAMARNVVNEGYVSQYYQLRNQSFTPFTWFYYALAKWQVLGVSPVVLRIPALVAGLTIWVLLRVYLAGRGRERRLLSGVDTWPGGSATARVVVALVFLAWWMPYSLGVRPESIVAVLALGVLVCVRSAVTGSRLGMLWLALVLAALSCTAHPTGFVALAPLLVALPRLWRLVARDRAGDPLGRPVVLARAASVLAAPVSLAGLAGFLDGTWYDFVRSQQIFLSIQDQNSWYDEFLRYNLLLSSIAMGSYAKRVAVLLALLALVWFVVLVAVRRAKGMWLPPSLTLAGWSLSLAFLLLWITPSKWTHHFGALSGIGPAFLGLFLLTVAPLVRGALRGRRVPGAVSLAAVAGAAVVAALSMHGPNVWAYSWMLGMPQSFQVPHLSVVSFDSLPVWLAGSAVLFAVTVVLVRRRAPRWRPVAAVLAAPLVGLAVVVLMLGYLGGSFVYAAAATWDGYSPQSANLRDPLSDDCGAGGAVVAADVDAARALPVDRAADPGSDADASPTGWFALYPPPAAIAEAGVEGTLTGPGDPALDDSSPEASTGESTSDWFAVPSGVGDDERVVVMAAGRLSGGNELEVEYGRSGAGGVTVVRTEPLADGVDSPVWRSFQLRTGADLPDGADVVRLTARDGSTDRGGWLAWSVPTVQPMVQLSDLIGDAPTAVSWQFAFNFPCAAQPVIRDGITQPVQWGIAWGDQGINGLYDNTWLAARGGLFGQLLRSAGATQLVAEVRGRPDVPTIQVYRFDQPLPAAAYDLVPGRETVSGLSGPGS